MNINTTLETLN